MCTLYTGREVFGSASVKGKSQFYTVKQLKLMLLKHRQKETWWGEKEFLSFLILLA